mmetsp:Transcript_99660/g.237587  ORF Transcript_99660/g.237587 Transcript_99660/m.237587 type:complete len:328 (+) Transcript_99660:727-1710(+)
MLDELLCKVEILCHQGRGQELVALGGGDGRRLLPVLHDGAHAPRVLPHLWQGLVRAAPLQRPKAGACGVRELPAVALPLGIGQSRWIRWEEFGSRTIAGCHRGIVAGLPALAEHIAHAAALDVGLIGAQKNVGHLCRAGLTVAVQEVGCTCFADILVDDDVGTPLLWHKDEIRSQLLLENGLFATHLSSVGHRRQVPVPVAHFAKRAGLLQFVDHPLNRRRGFVSSLRNARQRPKKPAAPIRVIWRGRRRRRGWVHLLLRRLWDKRPRSRCDFFRRGLRRWRWLRRWHGLRRCRCWRCWRCRILRRLWGRRTGKQQRVVGLPSQACR